MWTGWVGNDGQGGGPVINNAEAGYDWSTYPERLERNGISWKIYQDIGVLFLTYDENDGFFDHMVPPTPPFEGRGQSTVDAGIEIFAGRPGNPRGPYGLGVRVPMIVISPWSKGGWVCSELFDHTSLIRFIERRFAPGRPDLIESNITGWRRAICGDLTNAFDFEEHDSRMVTLPDTAAYEPSDLSVVTDADPGFLRRLAGHLESGRDSVSDPAFGNGHG
jgi:phospholipase C